MDFVAGLDDRPVDQSAMKARLFVVPLFVVLSVLGIVRWAARIPRTQASVVLAAADARDLRQSAARVDEFLWIRWDSEQLAPAEPVAPLQVLRRLSLALHGTIPSLQEIRQFEAELALQNESGQGVDESDIGDLLDRWTARMLDDQRFADYFAERLARSYVGTEGGQFVIFRRDRFVEWLSKQLAENRPYDELVRQMVADAGLWTGRPATNFVTAAYSAGEIDVNKLAGRSMRAFLGQRIDCAQCHDHPFDHWKQADFEGLAAYFGQVRVSIAGVEDKPIVDRQVVEYLVEDRKTLEKRAVFPAPPFHPEWVSAVGTRRAQLAAWFTHPANRRFERATANRVWGLLFGRPYVEPVDDLPDPGDLANPDLLDLLGADFREHGYDLRRLIQVIAASRAFRLDSAHVADDPNEFERLQSHWAVFPLVRLRPEQVIGSMIQAASIRTIDQNSNLLVRGIRFIRENDFVTEYGDTGEDELAQRPGTIPQTLLRMNGKLVREMTGPTPLNSSARIAGMASTDERCLEACYLVCLTRRPTPSEREHFLAQFAAVNGTESRQQFVEDLLWTLFNSPGFAWNH